MTKWQPIETAPHDEVIMTMWDGVNNKTGKGIRYYNIASYDGADWRTADEYNDTIDEPTHWAPLPSLDGVVDDY